MDGHVTSMFDPSVCCQLSLALALFSQKQIKPFFVDSERGKKLRKNNGEDIFVSEMIGMGSERKIRITQAYPLFVFVTLPLEISSKQVQEGMNMTYRFPVKKNQKQNKHTSKQSCLAFNIFL